MIVNGPLVIDHDQALTLANHVGTCYHSTRNNPPMKTTIITAFAVIAGVLTVVSANEMQRDQEAMDAAAFCYYASMTAAGATLVLVSVLDAQES